MAKTFNARIASTSGITTVKIMAASLEDAKQMAERQGRVLSVKKSKMPSFSRPMSRADRITLLRRLSMMVKSKVSLTNALKIISESFQGTIKRASLEIRDKIINGDDLVKAMESMPADFPPTTVSLVKSGMHGGELYQALNDASAFEYEMHQIGKGAKSGMMSAAFEFLMAAALILVTAYWVGPWVINSQMMKMAGDAVDIEWAFILADVLAALIVMILVSVTSLILIAYVFKPFAPDLSDKIVLKIPIFRDLVLSKTYYSVFYGLSLLISSGVRIGESLQLSALSAPAGAVLTDIENAIKALDEGKVWANEMVNLHPTDRACLATSQDRMEIAEAFKSVAVAHRTNYATRIEQVVPVLSIVSNLFMAMAGFLVFAMMMLPNLQLVKGIL
jgi:general secretion pathway protein F